MKKISFAKKYIPHFLLTFLFIVLALYISKIYYERVSSFSFFDEYADIIVGYFMVKGKTIYSEIFFNHQMIPVYISYVIQLILHPGSLYKLILYHRLFIIGFSLLMNGLLVYRFKTVGLAFMFVFELTKYYLFGNLFLAESMIVYPLVYLFCVVWEKLDGKRISGINFFLGGLFTWFVIFSREPYVPLVVFLYLVLIIGKKNMKEKIVSFFTFVILSLITFFTVPIKDYLYQIANVNFMSIFSMEAKTNNIFGSGMLQIFFYPIYIFFSGKWNYFREILIGLDILFFIGLVGYIQKKAISKILLIFFTLGFANARIVIPGEVFFGSFHLMIWYGLFIVIVFLGIKFLFQYYKQNIVRYALSLYIFLFFSFLLLSPQSFLKEKVDTNTDFTNNYARFYSVGEIIKALASPNDTLFIDMADSLVYWQAGLDAPYPYTLYYPVMDRIPKYKEIRLTMFQNTPPDFYYVYCPEGQYVFIPQKYRAEYVELLYNNEQTCIYINKQKVNSIPENKLRDAKNLGYTLR